MRPKGTCFPTLPAETRGLSVVGVDLGYSAKLKSCGLATSWEDYAVNCTFGECVRLTADAIGRAPDGPVVLALEAVLSTRHDVKSGNPIARVPSERGRQWYCQPGVLTFASALRFVDRLRLVIGDRPTVYLAEAFLTNKTRSIPHREDARQICRKFWNVAAFDLPDDLESASPYVVGVPPIREF